MERMLVNYILQGHDVTSAHIPEISAERTSGAGDSEAIRERLKWGHGKGGFGCGSSYGMRDSDDIMCNLHKAPWRTPGTGDGYGSGADTSVPPVEYYVKTVNP